jgi:hypothetical protein
MKVQQRWSNTPSTDLVWLPTKDGVQLARKVRIEAQMPTGGFVQYLNAHNGMVIDSYTTSLPRKGERSLAARAKLPGAMLDRQAATNEVRGNQSQRTTLAAQAVTAAAVTPSGINGSGYAFDPDPRTALNTDALTDTSSASAFDAAYSTKTLRDLTVTSGVYKLSGPFVNIKNIESPATAPSTTTNGVWTAKRGNNAFDDTNVYFHLDQSQRYIQSLGFHRHQVHHQPSTGCGYRRRQRRRQLALQQRQLGLPGLRPRLRERQRRRRRDPARVRPRHPGQHQ